MKQLKLLLLALLLAVGHLHAQWEIQLDLENFCHLDRIFFLNDSLGWAIAGCDMETDVGKPFLPIKQLHIAIPEDKAVASIQILSIQQQELTGTYNIMPTQPGQIPGEPEPDFVDIL